MERREGMLVVDAMKGMTGASAAMPSNDKGGGMGLGSSAYHVATCAND
jgi:hypothetical protein